MMARRMTSLVLIATINRRIALHHVMWMPTRRPTLHKANLRLFPWVIRCRKGVSSGLGTLGFLREAKTFVLLAQGRTRIFLQEELVLSGSIVKTHVSHICTKLDVHDRQEMMDLIWK